MSNILIWCMRISQNVDFLRPFFAPKLIRFFFSICYIRMQSISKNDCCAGRPILALPSAYEECLVTFKLMTSQVVQRARPLSSRVWDNLLSVMFQQPYYHPDLPIIQLPDYVLQSFSYMLKMTSVPSGKQVLGSPTPLLLVDGLLIHGIFEGGGWGL